MPASREVARSAQPRLPPASLRGHLLGDRYLADAPLGSDAFGARWLATDIATGEAVCVELLPRGALPMWSEIRSAATRVAALGDPNVARLLGHGVAAGTWPFLAMQHDGEPTLREQLARSGAFELGRVARIGAQCASALAATHRLGVLHGALSPDRIFLGAPSPLELARIAGFGLAPLVQTGGDALLESAPELVPYVSPELAARERLEVQSDIYSLGAILYELATGAPPFTGPPSAVLRQHRAIQPEPPSRRRGSRELAFRAFDKIIGRCLAKRPEQRYASAAELAVDLARLDAALSRLARAPLEVAPRRAPRSGPRAAAAPVRRSPVESCPARRPPRARGSIPPMPKVIVQGG